MPWRTLGGKKYDTSSKLNNVPPIGAPKATATPAAQAALRISRRFPEHNKILDHINQREESAPSLFSYLTAKRLIMLPTQLAICTKGPSLPKDRPDATDSANPTDFVKRTRPPRYPRMTKPGIQMSIHTKQNYGMSQTRQNSFNLRNATTCSLEISSYGYLLDQKTLNAIHNTWFCV